jgi:hypothetical protein
LNFDERKEGERINKASPLLVFLPQISLLLYKVHVCVYTLKLAQQRERGEGRLGVKMEATFLLEAR